MIDEEDMRVCFCGEIYDPLDEDRDTHWIVQTNSGWRCVV